MAVAPRPTSTIAEPNVTPMIDVLLVLLIVFMVASVARRHLEAQLPPRDSAPGEGTPIVLTVGAGAKYAVNQQPVAPDSLEAVLSRIYLGRPDKTLIVRGAAHAKYHEVFHAIDVARGAGVVAVGVDTRRQP